MGKRATSGSTVRAPARAVNAGRMAASRGAATGVADERSATQTASPRLRTRHLHAGLAAGIIAAAVALRTAFFLHGWPDVDSDLAIVGLMARHILYDGASPAFYYGQHYNGSLDAYMAVPFFAVFGPTNLALNLSAMPLLVLFLAATYWLGRAAYGTIPALLTLLYIALGPGFLLLMGSHYPVTVVVDGLGALLLLLAYLRLRAPAAMPTGSVARIRVLVHYAAIGLVAGLGIWSAQLIIPFIAVVMFALALARGRELARIPGLALLAGAVIGGWPLLATNLVHGGIMFNELGRSLGLPPEVARTVPRSLIFLVQVVMVLLGSLPTLFGSPHVCLSVGDTLDSYPHALVAIGSQRDLPCAGLNVIFSLAILVCYVLAARPLVHVLAHRCRARPDAPDTSHAPAAPIGEDARLALRGMLLAVAATTLALDFTSAVAALFPLTATRYLVPIYVTVPVIFGILWERTAPACQLVASVFARRLSQSHAHLSASSQRLTHWLPSLAVPMVPSRLVRGVVASSILLILLVFAGYGVVQSAKYAADPRLFALPASPADQQVLAALRTHGITRFVAPYWTCYRLVFESGERAVCAVHEDDGSLYSPRPTYNRYWPYVLLLQRTAHPAYIFLAGAPDEVDFLRDAATHGWPHAGYVRLAVAGYAIYYLPGGQD